MFINEEYLQVYQKITTIYKLLYQIYKHTMLIMLLKM
jgi:hypothetical protein